MSFKSSLYQYLSGDAGISALAGDRVFPGVIPSQVYDEASKRPCVVYSVEDTEKSLTFCGTETLIQRRVAFDCYAKTAAAAESLKQAVTDALEDFTGDMEGTHVDAVQHEQEFDVVDLEPGLFRERLVYRIWHT